MNNIREKEIEIAKVQIAEINSVIDTSSSVFKLIYSAQNFKLFFLLDGIFSVLIPVFFHILLMQYEAYSLFPTSIKSIFYIIVFLCWASLIAVRTVTSFSVAKKLGIKSNIFEIVKQILSTKLWIAVIPILVCSIIIPFKSEFIISSTWLVPYIGIVVGIVLNIIGVMTNEKEYSMMSFWMIAVGLVLFSFLSVPNHIAFGLIFAPACFIFVIIEHLSSREKRA